jgi:glucose-6-phosphate 1-dehydrogenase
VAAISRYHQADVTDAPLTGKSALSIRADEAEASWRVVTPVLDAWSKELVPLQDYAAGSDGPPRLPS